MCNNRAASDRAAEKAAAMTVADVNHQPTTSAQEAGRVVAERSAEAAGFKRLKNSRLMLNL